MGASREGGPESRGRERRSASRFPEAPDLPTETDDEDFLFHLYRGSELLQDGRELEAKEELEQALLRNPGDQKGQDLLALVYFRVGLYPRAIAIYEQLRQKSPRDPALQLNLALCYLKTGQPERARDELEALLEGHTHHPRAWGYLGLCLDRLGDFAQAQAAFEKSGHVHLARRMMERAANASDDAKATHDPRRLGSQPAREVRAFAREAFEELDAGQLDFSLAEPHSSVKGEENWRAIELGTHPPSTRDGPPPPPMPVLPQPAPVSFGEPQPRRPTLIVAPPPPGSLPTFGIPPAPPPSQLALPPVEPAPLSWSANANANASVGSGSVRPPGKMHSTPPGAMTTAQSVFPPPSAANFAKASALTAADDNAVSLHVTGAVIARPSRACPFATRLESIRTMTGALDSRILERKRHGVSSGETFGGFGSPLVELAGAGQIVVGPKPGYLLSSFVIERIPCTVREDRILGFQLSLAYQNDRLTLGPTDLRVVCLTGTGALILETQSVLVTLEVTPAAPVVARREVVVGWLGGLELTAVSPTDAPGAHHGLVRFRGEGSVMVSGL